MFDQGLAELAAQQHGVFSTAQARELGVDRKRLRRLVSGKHLARLHPGVYAATGAPETWRRDLFAAWLAAGPGAAVSHRAAAQIWGLLRDTPDLVELAVPEPRHPKVAGAVIHRSVDLQPAHVESDEGLPVTSPMRTIVDLGLVLRHWDVEDALDRGLTKRLFTVTAIEWMRAEVAERGRNGCGIIGTILDDRALGAAPADSLLEPRLARLLKQAGLPAAVYHYLVRDGRGRVLAEVDFAYPDLRLAIEVDGFEAHGTPRQMSRDFVRQNGLVPLGWHVLRFTWEQVVRQPEMVAATIRAALVALDFNFCDV